MVVSAMEKVDSNHQDPKTTTTLQDFGYKLSKLILSLYADESYLPKRTISEKVGDFLPKLEQLLESENATEIQHILDVLSRYSDYLKEVVADVVDSYRGYERDIQR